MFELTKWQVDSNYMGERYDNCYAIYTIHRDSDILDVSNYRCIAKELDNNGFSESYEFARASHWAVGWVETIVIPVYETKALELVQNMYDRLNNYPILDEFDYYELESELESESE